MFGQDSSGRSRHSSGPASGTDVNRLKSSSSSSSSSDGKLERQNALRKKQETLQIGPMKGTSLMMHSSLGADTLVSRPIVSGLSQSIGCLVNIHQTVVRAERNSGAASDKSASPAPSDDDGDEIASDTEAFTNSSDRTYRELSLHDAYVESQMDYGNFKRSNSLPRKLHARKGARPSNGLLTAILTKSMDR